ncbi:MAG TPA: adenosylcobinamide-GDP ribazoletransferase, partial [Acidimicrobiales bacterium]|nr:adenosylcobinamide-GDP ribazoletransferase [Acidimicrobiales bacterium]
MLSALGFLSILGRSSAPTDRSFRWFPAAGAVLGVMEALTWWGAQLAWPLPLAAAIAIAVDLAITGLLHVDGLADAADGLLPHLDRARRLEVMRQPDVGAFALGVVPCVLLLRWAALASGGTSPWSIIAVWSLSRTLAAAVPSFVPYARNDGLATPFLGASNRWVLIAFVPGCALLAVAQGPIGVLAAGVGAIGAGALVRLAVGRLGGFTGDVLGACILVFETLALIVLAA